MATIHHLGFLVRSLSDAVQRYSQLLGQAPDATEALPKRGVRTARFALGPVWLVLIEPLVEDSVPGQHLLKHGEGFFMLSLNSKKLEQSDADLASRGMALDWSTLRRGLDNWRVVDLKDCGDFGAVIQFAEESSD